MTRRRKDKTIGECANLIKICAWKKGPCDHIGHYGDCPYSRMCGGDTHTPSYGELMRMYVDGAKERHKNTRQLSDGDIRRSISLLRRFMKVCRYKDDGLVSGLTMKSLQKFADSMTNDGLRPDSVRTNLAYIKRMFCRWARDFYNGLGYDVHSIDVPEVMSLSDAYSTPKADLLTRFKLWFNRLQSIGSPVVYTYAMLMYHFAMRNGDVDNLKWENILEEKGRRIISYIPHKTSIKSKVRVKVEIGDVDWAQLVKMRELYPDSEFVIPNNKGGNHHHIRKVINSQMRELGFNGSKGSYEMRKMCADEYDRRCGHETAKRILGHTMVKGSTKRYVDGSCKVVPSIWL